jgi:hypothetical protein
MQVLWPSVSVGLSECKERERRRYDDEEER